VNALDGEVIIVKKQHTSRLRLPDGQNSRGTLFLSNYRLIYHDYSRTQRTDFSTEMPLGQLLRFAIVFLLPLFTPCARVTFGDHDNTQLNLICKDGRNLSFGFDDHESW
jgi:hypothetical protein